MEGTGIQGTQGRFQELLLITGLMFIALVTMTTLDFHDDVISKIPTTRANVTLNQPPAFMTDNELDPVLEIPVRVDIHKGNCSADCALFQRRLMEWPAGKPKGAVYFLFNGRRSDWMGKALRSLYSNFNRKYKYPVIMFYQEDDLAHLERILTESQDELYLQPINFETPDFLSREIPDDIECASRIGYRRMCEFHAKSVYEEAIISGLDFLWRLDDDSVIKRQIPYDIFAFMTERDLWYGYRGVQSEPGRCITGLRDATDFFVNQTGTQPYFYDSWPVNDIFYTNFEVSKLSLWLGEGYQQYIEYISKLGGIYYHRWGDAPIKSYAVSIFVPESKVHLFDDIAYQHGSFVAEPPFTL
ncbi:hypothetical protein CAPTEDRAFT_167490 [Capitella teleta]|uniref:Uncharacterized protein n=1 Tax=Capitella teleta TaxID=283909 RepID=R7VHR0_CAPTE|nr:hypothetical protein CAPTEDRAFT_167490 [Capitella teleta]|eukprot:ELU18107.1 hypothetical protein CAPTEDRAFT_167490 [Capitella teleta]